VDKDEVRSGRLTLIAVLGKGSMYVGDCSDSTCELGTGREEVEIIDSRRAIDNSNR
jgi:hypothetical protein